MASFTLIINSDTFQHMLFEIAVDQTKVKLLKFLREIVIYELENVVQLANFLFTERGVYLVQNLDKNLLCLICLSLQSFENSLVVLASFKLLPVWVVDFHNFRVIILHF